MAVTPQPFQLPLFVPKTCQITVGGTAMQAFPAWPVKPTPATGVTAPLAPAIAADISGKIAIMRLAQEPGGTWAAPRVGDAVMATARRGPLAVLVATENPTGEVVALNSDLERFAWPVPVLLVPGRAGPTLAGEAALGMKATVMLTGNLTPAASANNVIGHRPGRGKTIVVSTPKTGWFHCAGERATGIAVFLDLAARLAKQSTANLLFVAFAGHELTYLGAQHFQSLAPPPADVAVWLHIGANAAMQPLTAHDGGAVPAPAGAAPGRRSSAAPAVFAAAQAAFGAAAGYAAPTAPLTTANAAGELSLFQPAYPMIAGIIGASPVFHTPLDRAPIATTAAHLTAVSEAALRFLLAASGPGG
jgi:hypothetical protein